MQYKEEFEKWIGSPVLSESDKKEIANLSEDEKKDRFSSYLNFGTAGLRGLIGIGSFRMNIYTVRLATQAVANVIKADGKEACEKGVAVATTRE